MTWADDVAPKFPWLARFVGEKTEKRGKHKGKPENMVKKKKRRRKEPSRAPAILEDGARADGDAGGRRDYEML
jgi:hypothetical protein